MIVEPTAPVDLRHGLEAGRWGEGRPRDLTIRPYSIAADWVVLRGGAAPLHPGWARALRDHARAATVPFAFLGWGPWEAVQGLPRRGDVWALGAGHTQRWEPDQKGAPPGRHDPYGDILMRPMGEIAAGRLLDGDQHIDAPEIAR